MEEIYGCDTCSKTFETHKGLVMHWKQCIHSKVARLPNDNEKTAKNEFSVSQSENNRLIPPMEGGKNKRKSVNGGGGRKEKRKKIKGLLNISIFNLEYNNIMIVVFNRRSNTML